MTRALGEFEKAIHSENRLYPDFVWLAMLHYQFEAIHPFMDGNGRLGRLMIPLLVCSWRHLPPGLPLLYISPFFRRHKEEYEDLLLAVSMNGAWSEWVAFFLQGVAAEANSAWTRARKLRELRDAYRRRYGSGVGKIPIVTIDRLFSGPIVQIKDVAESASVSAQTAGRYVNRLTDEGVLVPVDENRKWGRTFAAVEIIEMVYGELAHEPPRS
jgi:Fic family protein